MLQFGRLNRRANASGFASINPLTFAIHGYPSYSYTLFETLIEPPKSPCIPYSSSSPPRSHSHVTRKITVRLLLDINNICFGWMCLHAIMYPSSFRYTCTLLMLGETKAGSISIPHWSWPQYPSCSSTPFHTPLAPTVLLCIITYSTSPTLSCRALKYRTRELCDMDKICIGWMRLHTAVQLSNVRRVFYWCWVKLN